MARRYRLTKVSDTMHRISLGRDTIGWCRKWDTAWEAEAKGFRGVGPNATEAFRELIRELNNASARKSGYTDARSMIDAQNAEVRREVDDFNALLRDAGLPPLARVKKGRRILV